MIAMMHLVIDCDHRNISGNAVVPAFPLAWHTFMGTPFPCENIYGNGVPTRFRTTTPISITKPIYFNLLRIFVQHALQQAVQQIHNKSKWWSLGQAGQTGQRTQWTLSVRSQPPRRSDMLRSAPVETITNLSLSLSA